MAKKVTTEPKKGSGSDNEKSPVNTSAAKDGGEPMDEIESAKPEESKSGPTENDAKPMEGVTKPAEGIPKPDNGPAKPADEPAGNSSAMEVGTADDFVVVEGGGPGDELAQEKATEKKNNGNVSAGAQLSNDSVAEINGILTVLRGMY